MTWLCLATETFFVSRVWVLVTVEVGCDEHGEVLCVLRTDCMVKCFAYCVLPVW